jgi:SAM-dependent methyltransferase
MNETQPPCSHAAPVSHPQQFGDTGTDERTFKLKQCKVLINKLRLHKNAWPFNQPVDPVALGIPDYFDVIQHPMDLGTVSKKLENGQYTEASQFIADVDLVWRNCLLYNPPNSDVCAWANELKAEYQKQLKALGIVDLKNEATDQGHVEGSESLVSLPGPIQQNSNILATDESETLPSTQECHQINRARWDELVDVHMRTEFYRLDAFKEGTLVSSIQPVITEELFSFIDIKGKSVLHLQCHFGQDTLSWLRLGAASVVGVDYSSEAIHAARRLASEIGYANTNRCRFICHDVLTLMDCEELRDDRFDLVITHEGVLCWLSDIKQWGRVVAHFMKPVEGIFYIFEFHPQSHIFDRGEKEDELAIVYPYFPDEKGRPIMLDSPGTYTGESEPLKNRKEFEWLWTWSDILSSLLAQGLDLKFVHEFPFSTYSQLPGMVQREDGLYYFTKQLHRQAISLTFSILATKRG